MSEAAGTDGHEGPDYSGYTPEQLAETLLSLYQSDESRSRNYHERRRNSEEILRVHEELHKRGLGGVADKR